MIILKAILFLVISWSGIASILLHFQQRKFSDAVYLIAKVNTANERELREACRDLITSEALVLKSDKMAERAKRTCETEFGL